MEPIQLDEAHQRRLLKISMNKNGKTLSKTVAELIDAYDLDEQDAVTKITKKKPMRHNVPAKRAIAEMDKPKQEPRPQ